MKITINEKYPVTLHPLGITSYNINIFCSLQCPLVEETLKSFKKYLFSSYDTYKDKWGRLPMSFYEKWPVILLLLGITHHNTNIFYFSWCPRKRKSPSIPKNTRVFLKFIFRIIIVTPDSFDSQSPLIIATFCPEFVHQIIFKIPSHNYPTFYPTDIKTKKITFHWISKFPTKSHLKIKVIKIHNFFFYLFLNNY